MTARTIYLLDEADTNTEIPWWNRNREKLNAVIRAFNQWQTSDRTAHGRDVVFAMIERCRYFGENNSFAEHQFETLQEMYDFLRKIDNSELLEEISTKAQNTVLSEQFIEKLRELGQKWMSESGRDELEDLIDSVRN